MQAEQMKNNGQCRAIYGLARKAGLESDALHDVVRRLTGVDSIAQLSNRQAIQVINHLKIAAGQGEPMGWATDAQRWKIFALCRELGWATPPSGAVDLKRLEGFVCARFRVAKMAWLQPDKAGRVIEALKAMVDGGRGERKQKTASV